VVPNETSADPVEPKRAIQNERMWSKAAHGMGQPVNVNIFDVFVNKRRGEDVQKACLYPGIFGEGCDRS